jgi:hypothetical protein
LWTGYYSFYWKIREFPLIAIWRFAGNQPFQGNYYQNNLRGLPGTLDAKPLEESVLDKKRNSFQEVGDAVYKM